MFEVAGRVAVNFGIEVNALLSTTHCLLPANLHLHEDQAGKELWEKIGGFLRHAFAGGGDALHLHGSRRIQEERRLIFPVINSLDAGFAAACVIDVGL